MEGFRQVTGGQRSCQWQTKKSKDAARLMCVFEVGQQANAQQGKQEKWGAWQVAATAAAAAASKNQDNAGKLPKHKGQFEHENVNKTQGKKPGEGRRKCVSQLVRPVQRGGWKSGSSCTTGRMKSGSKQRRNKINS